MKTFLFYDACMVGCLYLYSQSVYLYQPVYILWVIGDSQFLIIVDGAQSLVHNREEVK